MSRVAVANTRSAGCTDGRLGLMLTELRLPSIKRLAADMCAQSDREGWPGQRLLESLLEHEMAERETRRIERLRAESGLSPDRRRSSFEFSAVPNVSKAQVLSLAEGTEWLDRGANVLLFGPPGGWARATWCAPWAMPSSMPVGGCCPAAAPSSCSDCKRSGATCGCRRSWPGSIASIC